MVHVHIEKKLRATLLHLFSLGGLLPQGDVLDAGAKDGLESAYLSHIATNPARKVVAVEPLQRNIDLLRAKQKVIPNLEIVQGGLSNDTGTATYLKTGGSTEFNAHARDVAEKAARDGTRANLISFDLMTVDSLFTTRRLAFAHWDVEGMELGVLQGAASTLRRDRSFFTVEAYPKSKPDGFHVLMRMVHSLNYHAYEISETCGWPWDCRNFLCVPHERVRAFMKLNESVSLSALMKLESSAAGAGRGMASGVDVQQEK